MRLQCLAVLVSTTRQVWLPIVKQMMILKLVSMSSLVEIKYSHLSFKIIIDLQLSPRLLL